MTTLQKASYTGHEVPISALLSATPTTSQKSTISILLGNPTSETWPVVRLLTGREFLEQLYREGKLLNLPNPQPLSPEEQAERERLAQVLAGGKSMSEIISEGRGSY